MSMYFMDAPLYQFLLYQSRFVTLDSVISNSWENGTSHYVGDGEVDITEFDILEYAVTFSQEIDITEFYVTKKGN